MPVLLVVVAVALAGAAGVGAVAPAAAPTTGADTGTISGPTAQQNGSAGNGSGGMAYVRVGHFSPDAPNVDVSVDGERLESNLAFGQVNDYTALPAGQHRITIADADNSSAVVFNDTVMVQAGQAYTVSATGLLEPGNATNAGFAPLVLQDRTQPPTEAAAVRLAHGVPGAGAVDVTVGEGNNTTVLFDNASFRGATQYVEVPGGEYTLDVRAASANNSGDVIESFDVSVENGSSYTAYAYGEDADSLSLEQEIDGQVTNVRVAHFSPDAGPVDVYLDGEPLLTDVSEGTISAYAATTPTSHRVTITEAGNESAVVFNQTVALQAGDYTIAAAGEVTPGATVPFAPIVIQDNGTAPDENTSSVQLVHAAPGVGPVDVTIEQNNSTTVLYDNVSFGNASSYVDVPAGEYDLQIREATPSNDGEIVTTTSVDVAGGETYTAVATGYVTPENTFELVVEADGS